ncbi:MAG TPA: hypothetical protein VN714_14280 [Trebonia sp.]|nr:hypothetical protein [Trebonia sp.]
MERAGNGRSGLRWRVILEARWRDRLQEVTELSLAYHTATPDGDDSRHARRLLRRAVAARQRLANTEDALRRISTGTFGRCEQCAAPIGEVLLAAAPECRYCGRCASSAAAESSAAGTALTA